MAEKRLKAMRVLASDAAVKITKAARIQEENPLEAEIKLMFAIAQNTSVIAALMLEAMMEEDDE